MAESYRTGGGNYYSPDGGYVGGATYKFDQLGRIVGGIGPNGEQLDQNGKIVGFNYSTAAGTPYSANVARGFTTPGTSAVPASIAGGASGGSAGGFGGAAGQQPPEVAANRQRMFDALTPGQNYFAGGLGQQTSNSIANTMSGVDVPYTQAVQDRLFSGQADLNAGSRASQDDLIRRQLAERGMEGSGAGLAAMLGAGRDQSAANSTALSQIQNTAQTENFAARERARAQGESFLSSRSAAEAPYRLKEADLRAQSDYMANDPLSNALAGFFGSAGARSALGSPEPGNQLGLGTGGAFNVGGRPSPSSGAATSGPGSGANMGVASGSTPTRPMQASQVPYATQARQSVQGYNANPANFRVPGSSSGYVPRLSPTEQARSQASNVADYAQKIWYGTNLGGMF